MKLDEFVKQALLDITNGVAEAQRQSQLYIAPGYVEGKRIEKPQEVKFEVSVTTSAEGGGGIKILSFGDVKASGKTESTNKLTFEVPIQFNAPTPLNPLHYSHKDTKLKAEEAP
ncbi:hypothetical protein NAC44_01735 [Allorhizobium sp. BGMRC 0089]|uniref:hypothetical protein n=1 Tax=Allorhizobium sonneratiae TaxID=2934936 RepID=UPI002033643A|nr:hypothetical protein [Allorhizobium sonneratiae]MCM2291048.1 hypothetical protein [Allorhizobium sonneratiae]